MAGVKILTTITGDAGAVGGLVLNFGVLPKAAQVMYYFAPGRAADVVLRHASGSADGLLVASNVGDPDDYQSGPWLARSAPTVVTADEAVTVTVTVVLVK